MKLGIGSYAYVWAAGVTGYPQPRHPLTPLELLDKAAGLGVRVVQFADNLPLDRLTKREIKAVVARAGQLRIELELGVQGIFPATLRKQLRLAILLPASLLRLVLDTDTTHPNPDEVVKRIRPLMAEFEDAGVRLAIENHDRFKAKTLLAILDRLDSDYAGVCLDTANSFGCSEGPEAVLETLGPRVFNLHLKDYMVRRMPHRKGFIIEGRPAGEGQLDIPHILERLKKMGSNANVILELWPAPETSVAATLAKEELWVQQSVRYLRRHIPE